MTILEKQALIDSQPIPNLFKIGGQKRGEAISRSGLNFSFSEAYWRDMSTEANTPHTPILTDIIIGTGPRLTRGISKKERIKFGLREEGKSNELLYQLMKKLAYQPSEPKGNVGSALPTLSNPETVAPDAEKYAKSLGLYGALMLTKTIVREIFPMMTALALDKKQDPDDEGYSTICFTITTSASVNRVMELDDALQDILYERTPVDALLYFSFTYRFE